MPTYEYECTKCGKVFELVQPITEKAKRFIATDCTQCHNKAPVVRRIGSGGGILFKGSGFYQTDYRSESYKKAAKAESGGGDAKAAPSDSAKPEASPKAESPAEKRKKPKPADES